MELCGGEMKTMQNYNLKIKKRKTNLKLLPQRFKHDDVGTFTLTRRGTNPFSSCRESLTYGYSRDQLLFQCKENWTIMETLLPILLYLFQPSIVLNGTFLLDEISRSPQECPYVL